MSTQDFSGIRALTFDIFGTTVDWWTGMTRHIKQFAEDTNLPLDAVDLTRRWRGEFFKGLERVRNGSREFANLDVIHAEGLDILLRQMSLEQAISPQNRAALIHAWHDLPAWSDVRSGLDRLRGKFTTCALSNGGFAQLTNLAKNADLRFDCILSTEMSKHYKPDIEVYSTSAVLLDLRPDEIMMVAAHGWDLDGARAAGFRTGFVWRPDEFGPFEGADAPTQVVADLHVNSFGELADRLGC